VGKAGFPPRTEAEGGGGAVSVGTRLKVDLEVLTIAIGGYLDQLRSLWNGVGQVTGADVARIVASVGAEPRPSGEAVAHVRSLLERRAVEPDALTELVRALGLASAEELTVAAAWWAEADPQFAMLLGCAHDDGARRHASASLLRLVLEPYGVDAPSALDDAGPLVRCGVLSPGAGATGALELTPTARLVLDGGAPDQLVPPVAAPERLAHAVDALARHLSSRSGAMILLRGPAGVGRRGVAAAAAHAVDLVPVGATRPAPELKLLARLSIAVPVVPAATVETLAWEGADGALVAWGSPGEHVRGAYVVDLPAPSHAERSSCWHRTLSSLGLDGADVLAAELAARFAFTEGDIDSVASRITLDGAWRGREIDRALVWDAARKQPEHALERLAALVTPAFTLDDLVLTDETEAKLRELIAHVALQHVVLDDWGFRRRLPRGQGVAALFTGPPGTGKTTAAEALARELGQDLYRIDLAAVVSKYVGETEKNLATAFDEAERGSAVLFFDEADALFGKRTEIKDAHDRYANLEVNYLLQRVETFTGLVVLATNRSSAMDEALLRRLRFVIRFDTPDIELRRRLWRRSFPAGAAVDELDWDALAAVELAGGNIQSAALAAAYLAAADGGTITSAHVEHALLREHQKLGRAWAGIARGARA
jgi:AAA+ superfamily predicted ATPase